MEDYYIQNDFPTILIILYIIITWFFYDITLNFWLSFGVSTVIYIVAYLTFKLWTLKK